MSVIFLILWWLVWKIHLLNIIFLKFYYSNALNQTDTIPSKEYEIEDTIDVTCPTIWLYALQTVLHLYKTYLSSTITTNIITYSAYFLYKWSTRLQSTNNHMVGRAASVVSPFYSILIDSIEINLLQGFFKSRLLIWYSFSFSFLVRFF